MPTLAAPNQNTAFVLEVHKRLGKLYGIGIDYFHNLDPLSELVSSLLSHRTKNKDSGAAFKNLVATFESWEAVRDAPTAEVEKSISAATWPEQKAPRIQAILRKISEEGGDLSLDFIGEMGVQEARAWLEKLPGVGPKTSAAVISFSSLRGKALPVDSHHFRVAVRLGIVLEKVGEGKAHAVLEALLPEDFTAHDVYDHHELLMFHGQRVCFWRKPACGRCVLLDICPTGQALLAADNGGHQNRLR